MDPAYFRRGDPGRGAVGLRSPLVLSGLVLAGANRRGPGADGRGIVTAEAVAGLPLHRLDLAVCQSSLGEMAGGEGVFGLQRAFHLAGARNVVASLWPVEDKSTAALMGLFYRHLWVEKKPPLDALRLAQLYIYRHPGQIPALARKRGADFADPEPLPTDPEPAEARKGRVARWAGFVLSGSGK